MKFICMYLLACKDCPPALPFPCSVLPKQLFLPHTECNWMLISQSQSQSYFTADGQSVSKSWCRAQSGTFDQRYYFFFSLKVTVLSFGGALSDERSGLSWVSLLSIQHKLSVGIYIGHLQWYVQYVSDTVLLDTIYTIYTKYIRPRSVQALYSRLCPSYK
jgi:hypothetical protein